MEPAAPSSFFDRAQAAVDAALASVVEVVAPVVFAPVLGVPLIVLWLATAGVLFTLWTRFLAVRGFGHAVAVVAGRYDDPREPGDVTHRAALWSALSGTLGLGNIAGVGIALSVGGPGATFWMVVSGLFGMSLKFAECTLGQLYRTTDAAGRISGGPMRYLRAGLAERGLPRLGAALATSYAALCAASAFGAGNVFQISQATAALREVFPATEGARWWIGLALAGVVGAVTIGGIRSVGRVAERLVPAMCVVYAGLVLFVLARHATELPGVVGAVLEGAFSPRGIEGGVLGVMARGLRRATFSNEAGTGSASIAHSAARTTEPVRGGIVALLEPFVDTVVVCSLSAAVVLATGAWNDPAFAEVRAAEEGARLMLLAVGREAAWAPPVLALAITCFAVSTVLTWSYYGERCVHTLFRGRGGATFRVLFAAAVALGAVVDARNAKEFADVLFLLLAAPNIVGLYLLRGRVLGELSAYLTKLREGAFARP